jgi:RNA polymerase sigma factor (sigma-70 family)
MSTDLRVESAASISTGLGNIPDSQLIDAVRMGDVAAFGVLYERYLVPARRAAALIAAPPEQEDLVAEAFAKVLRMLRDGRGPDEVFLPYLLVTLRNTAISHFRRQAPVSLYADVPEVRQAGAADPMINRWDADLAAKAFATLPERWRVVLWHTEIAKKTPAEVGKLLAMRPNAVSALAYRAREGLRKAYLKLSVSEPFRRDCQSTVDKVTNWVRKGLLEPLPGRITEHLRLCPDCRARADALSEINSGLRALTLPLLIGAFAYLHAGRP